MPCSWCSEPATWMLLADADLHHHDHPACDEHRVVWGHLYRRAVAMPPESEIDLREADADADADADPDVDLRRADEPSGRHEA